MTKVYLDGYEIDVAENEVRQSFQRNNLGDVRTRQLNLTNTFKAYHTAKNALFFGYLNDTNSASDKPYRLMEGKVVVEGLEASVGTARVKRSNSEYVEIFIYSGINGLYENINNKSIRDLDWTGINHTITEGVVTSSFDEIGPYIYALCNQTNKINQQGRLETWLPSVYEWWLFDKIITEAGFTYEGDLFSTSEFKGPVINPVTFDENQADLLVRDFSKFMPDILQTEFVRDILFRYGLMFDKERGADNLVFQQIKDVFKDREGSIDWSEKFAGEGNTEFELSSNYGIRNYFRYTDREGYSKNADSFFELDVETLAQQKTVATSQYTVNQQVNVFNNLTFPIFIYDDNDEITIEEVDPSISTIQKGISGGFQFSSDSGNGSAFIGDPPYLRFEDLDMSGYIQNNYSELKKIANRAKVKDLNFLLDPIDIYNLNFFKLIYVRQQSSYFYINRINNFIAGKETKCEMVRIPPNVFSDQQAVNTPPTVELFVNEDSINQNETVLFTHNVADLENNIEKWELDFGDNTAPLTGFGLPPASISHEYKTPGSYTAILTVTDFEDAVGFDSVNMEVADTFVVTFNTETGEYSAPAGSLVIVDVQAGGSGDCSGIVSAGTTQGGNDLGSVQVNYNQGDFISFKQFVFVMPQNGTAYFSAQWFAGNSGPSPSYVSGLATNNGESIGFSASQNSPNFP